MIYNAPSVRYPVGRCFLALVILGAIWLAGMAAACAFLATASEQTPHWRVALSLAASGIAAVAGIGSWLGSASGELRWDGEQWFWYCGGVEVNVIPCPELDLQMVLLLSFDVAGERRLLRPTQWLWLERARNPAAWADMRRAVYSRARSAARQVTDDHAPFASTANP